MDRVLNRVSAALAGVLILASIVTLAGWQFRVPVLKGAMFGSFVAPNTALCFVLCGISVLLQVSGNRRNILFGRLLGLFVLGFAIATFAEWTFDRDFGIDRIFFAHRLSDWTLPFPGRFAVNSCVGFTFAGLSLLNIRRRSVVAEVLSSLILLISYLSIIGYMYSVPALYASGNIMAFPTAVLFTVLSVSLLCSGSGQVVDIVFSPYAGGIVSRRIITAIIILLPAFGLLEIKARDQGSVSREFGIALFVLVAVVVFTALVLRTALTLNRIDRQRLDTQSALRIAQLQQAQSLDELKLSLKRLELVEGAVNVGTWEFDIVTGISQWPPGISTLWGLPRQHHQVSFDQFVESIYPEDRERVGAIVQQAIASGDSYDVEFRVVWPDHSIHWLAARGAVIRDETERAVRIIGIALEVTQRHQTERALRESEKLAATGRLAATIAHEINNPLEAVVNLVYIARQDRTLSPAAREYLDTADAELARVSHMVRQTLGFYRESANPVWIDVADMIQQISGFYRHKLQRKSIALDLQLAPAQLHGFEGELRQVISNLISNAIDAVPFGGRIVVRSRQDFKTVRIIVADNGHGIGPEHRSRLFQPFFTTKKDVGTGLGLWVTKGIIDKHNGSVRIRSSIREGSSGTVFVLDFPSESMTLAQSAS